MTKSHDQSLLERTGEEGGRNGDRGGRGDDGRPLVLGWRVPRTGGVTETFRPLIAATFEALDILDATGVSGGDIGIG
jgi:hypothetical protein